MLLADTSVWIEHLRRGEARLEALLEEAEVACHPFVIGELACGTLHRRGEILSLLAGLPALAPASHEEVLAFIGRRRLHGKGLGYIDMHLLASCALSNTPLWTLDRRLATTAAFVGLAAA